MKLSARNVLKGTLVEITTGAVNAIVRIGIVRICIGGAVITSSITNAAVEELGPKVGEPGYAVIKASDVMVGRD